MTNDIDIWNAG